MLTYHKVKQGTPEWHALRVDKVTASNAYVLLARGKNAATGKHNIHSDSGSGYWAERGHILEREAIEIFESVYEIPTEEIGFITNSDYPGCGYSPDNMNILKAMPLEVKCFKEEKHLECLKGNIPNEVICQIQFGMMITEGDRIPLINYNPDIEDSSLCFNVTWIYRDELLIARFKSKLY